MPTSVATSALQSGKGNPHPFDPIVSAIQLDRAKGVDKLSGVVAKAFGKFATPVAGKAGSWKIGTTEVDLNDEAGTFHVVSGPKYGLTSLRGGSDGTGCVDLACVAVESVERSTDSKKNFGRAIGVLRAAYPAIDTPPTPAEIEAKRQELIKEREAKRTQDEADRKTVQSIERDRATRVDTLSGMLSRVFGDAADPVDDQGKSWMIGGTEVHVNDADGTFKVVAGPVNGLVALRGRKEGAGCIELACVAVEAATGSSEAHRNFGRAMGALREEYPEIAVPPTKEEIATKRQQVSQEQLAREAKSEREFADWKIAVEQLDPVNLLADLGYTDYSKDSSTQWHFNIEGTTVNVQVNGRSDFGFGALGGNTFGTLGGKAGSRGNVNLVKAVMELTGRANDPSTGFKSAKQWLDRQYPHLSNREASPDERAAQARRAAALPIKHIQHEAETTVSARKVPVPHVGDQTDIACRKYLSGRGLTDKTIDYCYRQGFFYSGVGLYEANTGPMVCSPVHGFETGSMVGVAIKPTTKSEVPSSKDKGINEGKTSRGAILLGDPSTAETVWVTEAAVDVASFYQMNHQKMPNTAFLAMTGARLPAPQYMDGFFNRFPNAKTFIGAFNNDALGRRVSDGLAQEANNRGMRGVAAVPEGGEFLIDVNMRGEASIGERQLLELTRWCDDHNVAYRFLNRPAEKQERLLKTYVRKDLPVENVKPEQWQTIAVRNTPESGSIIERLSDEASKSRSKLPEEARKRHPKEFSVTAIYKDWNDVLKGPFVALAKEPGALPHVAPQEDHAAAQFLNKYKKIPLEIAEVMVQERCFYATQEMITVQEAKGKSSDVVIASMITPICDFDRNKAVGYLAEDIPSDSSPVLSRKAGAVNHGATMVGKWNEQTKRVIITSSLESAIAKWEIEQPDETTCVMAYHGTRVPDRLLEICKARDLDLTVAMDSDTRGKELGGRIEAAAKAKAIAPDKLKREEPASQVLMQFHDTPEGSERCTRVRAMLTERKIETKYVPVAGGMLRITTDHTDAAEKFAVEQRNTAPKGFGAHSHEPGAQSHDQHARSSPAKGGAHATEKLHDPLKSANSEFSHQLIDEVEFISTGWSAHSYARSYGRDFERHGTSIDPAKHHNCATKAADPKVNVDSGAEKPKPGTPPPPPPKEDPPFDYSR